MVLERIKLWLRFFKPSETDLVIKEHKGKGTLKEGLINVLLSSSVPAVTIFIFTMLAGFYMADLVESGAVTDEDLPGIEEFSIEFVVVIGLFYVVFLIILLPTILLLGHGVLWGLAKVLGGTGRFAEQYYFGSFVMGVGNILFPLYFIPYLGNFMMIALMIYSMFLNFKIVKGVHGLSKVKAAAVVLIAALISGALFFALS